MVWPALSLSPNTFQHNPWTDNGKVKTDGILDEFAIEKIKPVDEWNSQEAGEVEEQLLPDTFPKTAFPPGIRNMDQTSDALNCKYIAKATECSSHNNTDNKQTICLADKFGWYEDGRPTNKRKGIYLL